MHIETIVQEELDLCCFRRPDWRISTSELRERNRQLYQSMLKGNDNNVCIVFNTLEGYKQIMAGIWAYTEKFVLLRGGSFIPVEAIATVQSE